jgi:hypothetical protein
MQLFNKLFNTNILFCLSFIFVVVLGISFYSLEWEKFTLTTFTTTTTKINSVTTITGPEEANNDFLINDQVFANSNDNDDDYDTTTNNTNNTDNNPHPTITHLKFLLSNSPILKTQNIFINNNNKKRNILFIKIPKVGGTAVAQVLRQYAKYYNLKEPKLPQPPPGGSSSSSSSTPTTTTEKMSLDTCKGTYGEKEQVWKTMIRSNHGKIDIFLNHACYETFMSEPSYWSFGRKPFTLTVLRHPWSQFISRYRFSQLCCDVKHWDWCETLCSPTLTHNSNNIGNKTSLPINYYVEKICPPFKGSSSCNPQNKYIGNGIYLPKTAGGFDFILTIERLYEGLALLYVLHSFPLASLITLPYNTNSYKSTGMATTTHGIDKRHETMILTRLKYDFNLYDIANKRMNDNIQKLNITQRILFNTTLNFLVEANELVKTTCKDQCKEYSSISPQKKECEKSCLQTFEEQVLLNDGNNII